MFDTISSQGTFVQGDCRRQFAQRFNFCDTFDLFHNQYKLNREESYNICLRAHRGGGFTKDYTYLTGLKKVYTYYKKEKDLNVFAFRKVNIGNADLITTWKKKGGSQKIRTITLLSKSVTMKAGPLTLFWRI